ncbi:CheR family methyltransferase [Eisenibacter elegans]|jgi:chemotaxis protein methyltransferase CheR|uniref:CheR family methyltransferase n=1 Tax=Eisenibacter elegans TaxID=997 RepID=UPI00042607BF|nr:protein-glutamate O-methyltransferase CheR [Eisenibacter elegans]
MQDIEIAQLKKLTELIQGRFDYDFSNYAMSSFKRRVQRLLEIYKYPSIEVLIQKLSEKDERFFQEFLSEITVNVTEMFRDPGFWKVLKDSILPNILLNERPIKIWHAGCSSGEEVFSMAIVLQEMKALDRVQIVASDIDTAIINKAKEGKYPIKNMELNQKNYERYEGSHTLSTYYKEEGNKAVFDKNLVRNVQWIVHNLVDGTAFDTFDLILCRNVMIYFNQQLQNQVLKLFHESLHKYSYLAVGSKESLIWCEIANKFIIVNNEEKVYKKVKD